MPSKVHPLDRLLRQGTVWQAGRAADRAGAGLPSGHPALDRQLSGGGWLPGNLVEILYEGEGSGELRLLLPLLARLSRAPGWILWTDPPHLPYPPALEAAGLDLDRMLLVRSPSRADRLWTLEQALKSGCCRAVLGWLAAGEAKALRRLQLAVAEGGGLGFLFRPAHCRTESSSAPYRLGLKPEPPGASVQLLKRKNGWPLPPLHLDLGECALLETGTGTDSAAPPGSHLREVPR